MGNQGDTKEPTDNKSNNNNKDKDKVEKKPASKKEQKVNSAKNELEDFFSKQKRAFSEVDNFAIEVTPKRVCKFRNCFILFLS